MKKEVTPRRRLGGAPVLLRAYSELSEWEGGGGGGGGGCAPVRTLDHVLRRGGRPVRVHLRGSGVHARAEAESEPSAEARERAERKAKPSRMGQCSCISMASAVTSGGPSRSDSFWLRAGSIRITGSVNTKPAITWHLRRRPCQQRHPRIALSPEKQPRERGKLAWRCRGNASKIHHERASQVGPMQAKVGEASEKRKHR